MFIDLTIKGASLACPAPIFAKPHNGRAQCAYVCVCVCVVVCVEGVRHLRCLVRLVCMCVYDVCVCACACACVCVCVCFCMWCRCV